MCAECRVALLERWARTLTLSYFALCVRRRHLSLDGRLVRIGRAACLVRAMCQLCGPRLTVTPTGAPCASVAPFFGDCPMT